MRARLGSAAVLLFSASALSAEAVVDYQKDVKPILAQKCYSCHGARKAKGRLRVDSIDAMLKGGDSGPAIVAGKSKDSPLIQSLTGDGDIKRMPPKGRGLPKEQIELLKKWVDAGAKAP
jgi:mono/diheme cytochrome c family protein